MTNSINAIPSETHATGAKAVEAMLKIINKMQAERETLPAKALMRQRYWEYTIARQQFIKDEKARAPEGAIGSIYGFPIVIDENLPWPVMARFVNDAGVILSEIRFKI